MFAFANKGKWPCQNWIVVQLSIQCTSIKMAKISVQIIIFKMPPLIKSHYLLLKVAVSERKIIEKMTNFKKPQITSLCIAIRTNF